MIGVNRLGSESDRRSLNPASHTSLALVAVGGQGVVLSFMILSFIDIYSFGFNSLLPYLFDPIF
jgi:hypothetical protein